MLNRVWTEESNCTVLNSSIIADINCSYNCGSECRKSSRYPCLQVYVSLNSSGRVLRLSHNEEAHEANPECFYIPKCHKDSTLMHTIVMNISERLKTHQQVSCYYDPSDQQDSVLLTRLYGRGAIISSLLWPTCMLVGGTLIIAMVKLTQYLSFLCERISRIKRMELYPQTGDSHARVCTQKYNGGIQDGV
ncbi:calcium-activated potassium channel subunit beta-2 isoform X3 [Myxocyprinus asiaticus]|uniref:calcium-activated potassium channel subunit beta-2 isoform X3 n=1 Tax=Myxocyprinus asiaticus TaxID=70543 RepID=UPI002222E9C6|nr:calcium-activated potassium channel subunit beta-2 isoform X3 [Myxocyprinus asiaticus]